MIKVEKIGEEERLLFRDVKQDQFFIDRDYMFCQKVSSESYNVISTSNDILCAGSFESISPDVLVIKIFPTGSKLVKIIIE